ncbi:MAG TPA: AAA family ATPase [Trebonia sp.]|nr:AAA family ATPase [Trebonia sp.]
MELLERQSPLAELVTLAGRARDGEGAVVLLSGESGVGKTVLLERLQQELPGARWSWSACDGLFTPRPLGPLFDVAGQLGGELEELCHAGAGREELFGALLRRISEPGTLDVVVVEDVHWADEATTDLLRFLGRRLRGVPALLIVRYRDEGLSASHPLRVALGDLSALRQARRVLLEPLSAASVRRLAAASGLDPAELYRLTGGNPFFVTEVLQAGVRQVPAAARDAVLARAARLSAGARELLDAAALLGTRVEPGLIAAAAPGSAALVDEILASGLLTEDGSRLSFRHEIARLAIEQAIPAHRRGLLHGRILAALLALGCADDARLAYHAEGARDGPAVLRYAPAAAGRAAALASHQEAAAQYRRALRFAEPLEPAEAAALYDGLATECSLIDQWEEAGQACSRALELWRQAGDRLGGHLHGLRRHARLADRTHRDRRRPRRGRLRGTGRPGHVRTQAAGDRVVTRRGPGWGARRGRDAPRPFRAPAPVPGRRSRRRVS